MLDTILRPREYKLLQELARRKKLKNWQEALRFAIENACRKFADELEEAEAEHQAERLRKWEALQTKRRAGSPRERLAARQRYLRERAEADASAPPPRPAYDGPPPRSENEMERESGSAGGEG